MKKFVTFFTLLIILSDVSFALNPNRTLKQYGFQLWRASTGLRASVINAILQTPDGYLWLGTDNGLYRFDGLQFKAFTKENTPGLTDNDISSLAADTKGNLWIGLSNSGICKLSAKSNFASFSHYSKRDGLPSNSIRNLLCDTKGNLWIGTDSGLCKLTNTHYFTPNNIIVMNETHGLTTALVQSMCADSFGNIWIVQDAIKRKQSKENIFHTVAENGEDGLKVFSIFVDRRGTLWCGKDNGLYFLHLNKIIPHTISSEQITSRPNIICDDSDNNLWVGTDAEGVFRITEKNVSGFSSQDGLSGYRIFSLLEDREKNIWIGTRGGGLNRFRDVSVVTISKEDGLTDNHIWSVSEDSKHTLWIGTRIGGVNKFQQSISDKENTNGNNFSISAITKQNGLTSNSVRVTMEDKEGNIWLGTRNGINKLRNGIISTYYLPTDSSTIRVIFQDSKGTIYIGTSGDGIWVFENGNFVRKFMRIGISAVKGIREDKSGALWFATRNGIFRMIGTALRSFTEKDGVAGTDINVLYIDSADVLWASVNGKGLSFYDKRKSTDHFFSVTTKEGLIDDVINSIIEDDSGNLWMGSTKGIFRVTKQDIRNVTDGKQQIFSTTIFGSDDGMKNIECNGGSQPAACKRSDGTLWFPTVNGIAIIDPHKLHFNSIPPPIIIDEIYADGEIFEITNVMEFASPKRKLEFHFSALSFIAPENTQFKFLLEGFDEHWVSAGTRRIAYYTAIPSGEYIFRVQACNNHGVWNETGTSVAIYIAPYFWQRWWFITLVLLTLAIAVVLIMHQFRIAKNLEIERLRLRIANDFHDEVGSNLGAISLLSDILQHKPEVDKSLLPQLAEINKTARHTSEAMREIVWFIKPEHDTLTDIINKVKDFTNTLLVGIEHSFHIHGIKKHTSLDVAMRRNIFLIYKELLHNIIKHSKASQVTIRIEQKHNNLLLTVQDNGIGFETNRVTDGNGLKSIHYRVSQIEGKFHISSTATKGTIASLQVKIP